MAIAPEVDFLRSDSVWRSFLVNLEEYALVVLDEGGHVVAWSEGARVLKGYSASEVIDTHFSRFYTPEATALGHPERELAVAASVGRYEEEGWRVKKGGGRFWAHVVIHALYDEDHVLRGFGKVVRDFTQKKQAAEENANILALLERTSRADYLTGLDNRRSFDTSFSKSVATARRHGRPLALAMVDLDHFKAYNDSFGHQAGDSLLKRAANAWQGILRTGDLIARYGGEEFTVVLEDTSHAAAVECLNRLRLATPTPLTCSIGIAELDAGETPNALIGRADRALYAAKAKGRNCLVFAESAAPSA